MKLAVPKKFNSLHDYLDVCFDGIDPTEKQILKAKQWYWRCYNTDFKRRRTHYTNLSIYFTKDEIERIRQATKNDKVSDFVKRVVLSYLDGTNNFSVTTDTTIIEEQLFLIAEYLLELINDDRDLYDEALTNLASMIKKLESQIEAIV